MILLDTHVFIWAVEEPGRLSKSAARAILSAARAGGVGVASITLWEIALLVQRGRLRVRGTSETWIREALGASGVVVREITPSIATMATQFPESFPRDPADRLIAATAVAERTSLVTRDERLTSPLLKTIW